MVITDISQLTAECNSWRQHLRNNRDSFTQLRQQLRKLAAPVLNKDLLQEVEHYENQFHIQLINIHDLKHAIKAHEQQIAFEQARGNVTDETLHRHEQLLTDYHHLDGMLQELRTEFTQFQQKV
jgi:hypothetical protein